MSLDVFQQVFSLSSLSNRANDLHGTQVSIQQWLQNEVTSTLPRIGAGWKLVWGPVVWKKHPNHANSGPENSWYIAFNPSLQFEDGSLRPGYVISIAGTPILSTYVWFKENLAVSSVASFNAWVAGGIQNLPSKVPAMDISPGQPYIAIGTANTVRLLLTTAAPEGAPAAGVTLLDFIANLDHSSSPRVISTGHSLGGALSPSLALALVSARILPVDSTLTYPVAGPSPGNGGFTELFSRTFPTTKRPGASAYQGWNLNLVNTLDVVPQAWCPIERISPEQYMGRIPPIYGLPALSIVSGAISLFNVRSISSGVWYKPLPSQYFTGPPPSAVPKNLIEFLGTLYLQHSNAYYDQVGVKGPALHAPLGTGLSEKSEEERLLNYPVIAELEWAHVHPEAAKKIINEVENSPEGREVVSTMKNEEA